jgi:hypothetical protein
MIFDFLLFTTRSPTAIVSSVSTIKLWIVCRLLPLGIYLHSLGMWGLIVWLYRTVSLFPVCIVSHDPFSVFSEASTSTFLQKGRSTSLSIIYLHQFTFTVSYVQTYHVQKPPLQINYFWYSLQPWNEMALAPIIACGLMTPQPSA